MTYLFDGVDKSPFPGGFTTISGFRGRGSLMSKEGKDGGMEGGNVENVTGRGVHNVLKGLVLGGVHEIWRKSSEQ